MRRSQIVENMEVRTASEIKLDIEELEGLLIQAKRPAIKDLLTQEVRKLTCELIQIKKHGPTLVTTQKPQLSTGKPYYSNYYTVKLTNYAWDQSDKFLKIYVSLKGVQTLPLEQVTCDFTASTMRLRVHGLDEKNYELYISDFCEQIDPTKCFTNVKTDRIVITMSKKVPKQWSHVTATEKRMKEAKNDVNMSDPSDPESSLMNLMKKMYQDGDDDMKRTIAKAWTESQEKRGVVDDMPRMPMV